MLENANHNRRTLLGGAVPTSKVAQMPASARSRGAANDAIAAAPSIKPSADTPFGPLKQIDAGVLSVGYAEAGRADGPAVILLHGWPYDIHSFVDVAPLLATQGYRVIVPYLRGYGLTAFRSADTPRNGQPTALSSDVVALMDALKIDRATIAGFDWGTRSADIVAALSPERCRGLVSVSGYLIGSQVEARFRCRHRPSSVVVPVLLRHRTRAGRLRQISAGLCQAHLGDRVAAMEIR